MNIKRTVRYEAAVLYYRWTPFEGCAKDCALGLPLWSTVTAVRGHAAYLNSVVCWSPICPRAIRDGRCQRC